MPMIAEKEKMNIFNAICYKEYLKARYPAFFGAAYEFSAKRSPSLSSMEARS